MGETRKLAAILVSDVVGYGRLAGADEDRTLARLRGDLIDPTITRHHGRVVMRTREGSIVEFRSVVDALRCAIEVLTAMVERNSGVPDDWRIVFRIGIHLGDVVRRHDRRDPAHRCREEERHHDRRFRDRGKAQRGAVERRRDPPCLRTPLPADPDDHHGRDPGRRAAYARPRDRRRNPPAAGLCGRRRPHRQPGAHAVHDAGHLLLLDKLASREASLRFM